MMVFEFDLEGGAAVFGTVMDVFFILDVCKFLKSLSLIVVSFNSGFYKKGVLIMKRKEIV